VIRAIAFDLFDTLVDQNHDRLMPVEVEGRKIGPTVPALHGHAVESAGITLSLLEFAEELGRIDRALRADTIEQGIELATLDRFVALATHLGCDAAFELAQALTEVHMGLLSDAVTVPEHHEAILTSLALDYQLALCSNFTHAPTARAILSQAGFDAHLGPVVISEEIGIRKPRGEIFEAVHDAMALAPEEILHVGDSLEADVSGAASVGMKTVWLTRRVHDPDATLSRFEGPRPDFALDDLMDLPVLVARLAR
jgi:FMN phosphatase YigB (HAD superfamily)